jgi:hypothetical protein
MIVGFYLQTDRLRVSLYSILLSQERLQKIAKLDAFIRFPKIPGCIHHTPRGGCMSASAAAAEQVPHPLGSPRLAGGVRDGTSRVKHRRQAPSFASFANARIRLPILIRAHPRYAVVFLRASVLKTPRTKMRLQKFLEAAEEMHCSQLQRAI